MTEDQVNDILVTAGHLKRRFFNLDQDKTAKWIQIQWSLTTKIVEG